jgi:hypothetical protein
LSWNKKTKHHNNRQGVASPSLAHHSPAVGDPCDAAQGMAQEMRVARHSDTAGEPVLEIQGR